jgi:IclR family acetate operon transcriptional repressor
VRRAGDLTSADRSLERGLHLLESVALYGEATLAEMSGRAGLPPATAQRLLQTLIGLGYLRQGANGAGSYELGTKPYELTARGWSTAQVQGLAPVFLAELTRRTGLGSSLAVYRAGRVTIAARWEHDGPVRVAQDTSARRPIHCTAVGKVLTAWLSRRERVGLLARTSFTRRTPKTITSRRAFEAELERVRAAGYALDDEEDIPGIRCIAMPVFGPGRQVVAAMCAIGPSRLLDRRTLRALSGPLGDLTRALSARLGGPPQGNGIVADAPPAAGDRRAARRSPGTRSRARARSAHRRPER